MADIIEGRQRSVKVAVYGWDIAIGVPKANGQNALTANLRPDDVDRLIDLLVAAKRQAFVNGYDPNRDKQVSIRGTEASARTFSPSRADENEFGRKAVGGTL